MATAVLMPKQGQTVESCIIVEWKKRPGDSVAEGEILCEVETDKAVLEVPSPTAGTLLARFFNAGDDVPVLTAIAAIGAAGEDARALRRRRHNHSATLLSHTALAAGDRVCSQRGGLPALPPSRGRQQRQRHGAPPPGGARCAPAVTYSNIT